MFWYSSGNRNWKNCRLVTRKHTSPKRWAQPLHACSYPTFDRINSDDLVLVTQEYMSQRAGLNLRTLTDLQPLTRSTQIVSEHAKVTDMSVSEYMQARRSYFERILWRAGRRELEMKHHLEVSAATVIGTFMQAQAQAPKDCSCLCDILFGCHCRISHEQRKVCVFLVATKEKGVFFLSRTEKNVFF